MAIILRRNKIETCSKRLFAIGNRYFSLLVSEMEKNTDTGKYVILNKKRVSWGNFPLFPSLTTFTLSPSLNKGKMPQNKNEKNRLEC